MQFRKMQLANGLWRLFGQLDTGTIVIAMPNIASNYDPNVIDNLGNKLATAEGASYEPENCEPFD